MARAGEPGRADRTPTRLPAKEGIQTLLGRLREHLGLDVCIVNEITRGKHVVRFADGDADSFGVTVGDVGPADQTYCQRVLEGSLPALVQDARSGPWTATLPDANANVGAYIGFPIVLPSGRVFGTLCAVGHCARPDLDERDVDFVRMVATLIADQLATDGYDEAGERRRRRIEAILEDPAQPRIFLQPIVTAGRGTAFCFEALSRFDHGRPEEVFAEAWAVGLGEELELRAIRRALKIVPMLPASVAIAVNVSSGALLSDGFAEAIEPVRPNRVILEITEHDAIESYVDLHSRIDDLLDRGLRLAIDDVGAGYSSLVHIMELSPDILKLDPVFARDIDSDPVRRALVHALRSLGRSMDAAVVAEGVESKEELDAVRDLGVEFAQGFYVGRPAPIGEVVLGAAR